MVFMMGVELFGHWLVAVVNCFELLSDGNYLLSSCLVVVY